VAGSFVVDANNTGAGVRFAVHGVRRVPGGSVLDYSVTALEPRAGEGADPDIDLDFFGLGNAPNVNLIDPGAEAVYRPLAEEQGGCVCTFVYDAGLEAGVTDLHQAAFPDLPEELSEVTVEFGNGPLVQDVPVTPEGQVATASEETDLAAPAQELPVAGSTEKFVYPVATPSGDRPEEQPLRIDVNEVLAGSAGTTLVWTVSATRAGAGWSSTRSRSPTPNWRRSPCRRSSAHGRPRVRGCVPPGRPGHRCCAAGSPRCGARRGTRSRE